MVQENLISLPVPEWLCKFQLSRSSKPVDRKAGTSQCTSTKRAIVQAIFAIHKTAGVALKLQKLHKQI